MNVHETWTPHFFEQVSINQYFIEFVHEVVSGIKNLMWRLCDFRQKISLKWCLAINSYVMVMWFTKFYYTQQWNKNLNSSWAACDISPVIKQQSNKKSLAIKWLQVKTYVLSNKISYVWTYQCGLVISFLFTKFGCLPKVNKIKR